MVDRYDPESENPQGCIAFMQVEEDGDYVMYADYEALEAKLARLVVAASHAYSEWDGVSPIQTIVAMRKLKDAIDAAKGDK